VQSLSNSIALTAAHHQLGGALSNVGALIVSSQPSSANYQALMHQIDSLSFQNAHAQAQAQAQAIVNA